MNAPPPDIMSVFCAEKKKRKWERQNTNKYLLSESDSFTTKLFQSLTQACFQDPGLILLHECPSLEQSVKPVMFVRLFVILKKVGVVLVEKGKMNFGIGK